KQCRNSCQYTQNAVNQIVNDIRDILKQLTAPSSAVYNSAGIAAPSSSSSSSSSSSNAFTSWEERGFFIILAQDQVAFFLLEERIGKIFDEIKRQEEKQAHQGSQTADSRRLEGAIASLDIVIRKITCLYRDLFPAPAVPTSSPVPVSASG